MLMSQTGTIEVEHLPQEIQKASPKATPNLEDTVEESTGASIEELQTDPNRISLDEGEKQTLLSALKMTNWNISEASSLLGISRTTFYRKLKKHGLSQTRG